MDTLCQLSRNDVKHRWHYCFFSCKTKKKTATTEQQTNRKKMILAHFPIVECTHSFLFHLVLGCAQKCLYHSRSFSLVSYRLREESKLWQSITIDALYFFFVFSYIFYSCRRLKLSNQYNKIASVCACFYAPKDFEFNSEFRVWVKWVHP